MCACVIKATVGTVCVITLSYQKEKNGGGGVYFLCVCYSPLSKLFDHLVHYACCIGMVS